MQTTQQVINETVDIDEQQIGTDRRGFAAFRTRNVKLLFAILFGLGFAETLWILAAGPFTGDLAFDAGFAVGLVLVGGSIDAVVAGVITVTLVSAYHAVGWTIGRLSQ